jgi:hypothetical protein
VSLSTPVAFIIFNRPDLTAQVFRAIAAAKPSKLLIIADGPRSDREGESEKCAAARRIVDEVDWDCEVLTNYSEENLGCKARIASGLTWVFQQVEEAIILEDDCVPEHSFFGYCSDLLKRYREDARIFHISGTKVLRDANRPRPDGYSYWFSRFPQIWGWATWRRAWAHYDVTMSRWPEFKKSEKFAALCRDTAEREYWISTIERVYSGGFNTWDAAWLLACWLNNAISIAPSRNLVSNLGFRTDATHTKTQHTGHSCLPLESLRDLVHPPAVAVDDASDNSIFDSFYGGANFRRNRLFIGRLISRARKVAHRALGRDA